MDIVGRRGEQSASPIIHFIPVFLDIFHLLEQRKTSPHTVTLM